VSRPDRRVCGQYALSVSEPVDPDDFMTQARAFFEAMGQPIDEPMPEVPDAADEFNLILTRAEVSALLPLIATAQQRAEIDADPWIEEQKQWWAVTRARLEALAQ
jgi:hypothetical protein